MNKKLLYIIVALLICTISSNAESKLSTSELLKISGSSISVALLGLLAENFVDESSNSLIKGPILFDSYFQKQIGGDLATTSRKTNFLDNKTGATLTPLVSMTFLLMADYAHYSVDKKKFMLQDAFLFTTGLMATGGVTGIFKGLVARERPLYHEQSEQSIIFDDEQKLSFFSGHSSLAFYSMHYLNKRLSTIMREKQISKKWHVIKSTTLYGWASFVAVSRIHASKHYASDVIVGAGVGVMVAELFYRFGEKKYENISLHSSGSKFILSYNF